MSVFQPSSVILTDTIGREKSDCTFSSKFPMHKRDFIPLPPPSVFTVCLEFCATWQILKGQKKLKEAIIFVIFLLKIFILWTLTVFPLSQLHPDSPPAPSLPPQFQGPPPCILFSLVLWAYMKTDKTKIIILKLNGTNHQKEKSPPKGTRIRNLPLLTPSSSHSGIP